MNRINKLFNRKQTGILNIYCTAGYPQLESTKEILLQLEKAGADLVEIGMPYSDPLADGPTIQASSTIALENGMCIEKLFQQLEGIRATVDLPIILMGYLNPVIQYGVEHFLKKCKEVGVDGLIIPDLPMFEYQQLYQPLFEGHGIKLIFLITPQTSVERIRAIDEVSNAFIYVVSTASTTGQQSGFGAENKAYFKKIKELNLKNPSLIGFGISDREAYQTACEYANGAIIGSAFIRMIEKSKNQEKDIADFIKSIKTEA
jgi:tryptophan synthase alpha chain